MKLFFGIAAFVGIFVIFCRGESSPSISQQFSDAVTQRVTSILSQQLPKLIKEQLTNDLVDKLPDILKQRLPEALSAYFTLESSEIVAKAMNADSLEPAVEQIVERMFLKISNALTRELLTSLDETMTREMARDASEAVMDKVVGLVASQAGRSFSEKLVENSNLTAQLGSIPEDSVPNTIKQLVEDIPEEALAPIAQDVAQMITPELLKNVANDVTLYIMATIAPPVIEELGSALIGDLAAIMVGLASNDNKFEKAVVRRFTRPLTRKIARNDNKTLGELSIEQEILDNLLRDAPEKPIELPLTINTKPFSQEIPLDKIEILAQGISKNLMSASV